MTMGRDNTDRKANVHIRLIDLRGAVPLRAIDDGMHPIAAQFDDL